MVRCVGFWWSAQKKAATSWLRRVFVIGVGQGRLLKRIQIDFVDRDSPWKMGHCSGRFVDDLDQSQSRWECDKTPWITSWVDVKRSFVQRYRACIDFFKQISICVEDAHGLLQIRRVTETFVVN